MTTTQPQADFIGALARGDLSVFQDDEVRRAELLADLVAAAWGTHGEFIDADQFLTKPTVLRRLASILAERVPADVDRLLGRDPHSLVLGRRARARDRAAARGGARRTCRRASLGWRVTASCTRGSGCWWSRA